MKIRTDFVTNSSSSGYVIISVVDGSGKREEYEFDYDTGYGGYFWNLGIKNEIQNSLSGIRTGDKLADILEHWFNDGVLESVRAKKFIGLVRSMESVKGVLVEEQTGYDDGDRQSAKLICRFKTDEDDWDYRYDESSVTSKGTKENETGDPLLELSDMVEPEPTEYDPYIDRNPVIQFEGKTFIFTGMGYWRHVPETDPIVSRVIERGGILRQNVSNETDCLVVGTDQWEGSIVEAAVEQKKNGKDIRIILLKDLKKALERPAFKTNKDGTESKHCDLFDDPKEIKPAFFADCGYYGIFSFGESDGPNWKDSKIYQKFHEYWWNCVGWGLKTEAETAIESLKKQLDYPFYIVGDVTTEKLDAGQINSEYKMLKRYKERFGIKLYSESDIVALGKRPFPKIPDAPLPSIEGLNVCSIGFDQSTTKLIRAHGGVRQKSGPTLATDVLVIGDSMMSNEYYTSNYAKTFDRFFEKYKKTGKPLMLTESQFYRALELIDRGEAPAASSMDASKKTQAKAGALNGYVCCLTGDFSYGSKDSMGAYITSHGGSCTSSVTAKTNMLIIGAKGSAAYSHGSYGTKYAKAKQMQDRGANMTILTEKEFFDRFASSKFNVSQALVTGNIAESGLDQVRDVNEKTRYGQTNLNKNGFEDCPTLQEEKSLLQKDSRQKKILQLIRSEIIDSVESLASRLKKEGFPVSKEELSHDIDELGLVKVRYAGNRKKYVVR